MKSSSVFKFAFLSRLCIILLQVVFNLCIPNHNADAFEMPVVPESGTANDIVSLLLEGFTHWDAQYFLHIAMYGYTHENAVVFLPLFPLLLNYFGHVLHYILPFLGILNCIILAGVVLNFLLFSISAVFLHLLTREVLRSEINADATVLLYCISPASVFFSSLYSESVFATLTFGGLWALQEREFLVALAALSVSGITRSNGIISFGFLVHAMLKHFIVTKYSNTAVSSKICSLLLLVVKVGIMLLMYLIPFIAFQVYCYYSFCLTTPSERDLPDIVVEFLMRKDYGPFSEPSHWCHLKLPFSYSYIQSHHWNVGFLRYYTFKQIPNFLLALPIFLLVVISSIKYFNMNRKQLWHLGLIQQQNVTSDIYNSEKCFPFFVHAFALAIFCAFFIHVQVMTRMLCSSTPLPYWIAASLLLRFNSKVYFKQSRDAFSIRWLSDNVKLMKRLFQGSKMLGKIIFLYFIGYTIFGTALHVNFYPWT